MQAANDNLRCSRSLIHHSVATGQSGRRTPQVLNAIGTYLSTIHSVALSRSYGPVVCCLLKVKVVFQTLKVLCFIFLIVTCQLLFKVAVSTFILF